MNRAAPAAVAASAKTERRAPGRALSIFRWSGASAVGLALALALLACAALAGDAQAFKQVDSAFGTTSANPALGATFNQPAGVAVRQSTGQIYVYDRNNRRVQRFSSTGAFERAWGWDVVQTGGTGDDDVAPLNQFEICTVASQCKAGVSGGGGGQFNAGFPQGVAIDQATGAVLVTDASNRRVQKFDADGNLLRAWGRDVVSSGPGNDVVAPVNEFEICVPANGDVCKAGLTGVLAGEFNSGVNNVAVDAAGNVLVGDASSGGRVQKFDADGSPLRAWGWDVVSSGPGNDVVAPVNEFEICVPANGDVCKAGVTGTQLGQFASGASLFVAADSLNRVYVSDSDGGRVQRFQPDGTAPDVFGAADLAGAPQQIAVDRSDDNVYVVLLPSPTSERQIKQLTPAGALAADGAHAIGEGITSSLGMALHDSSGRLYLSSTQGGQRVLVLDDDGGVQAGSVTVLPATAVGAHSATFNALVNPNGFDTTYRFEYSADGVSWTPVGGFQSAGGGNVAVPVSATVGDLEANRLYRVRVVVSTLFAGESTSAELTFATDTVAPEVTTGSAQQVTSHSAQVRGRINPNNLATTYRVEYGKTSDYGSTVPVPDASAGSGGIEQLSVVQLSGLDAAKTYHYRFVATSSKGTTPGADRTFVTRAATSPGGERAYEMVTPPDKSSRNGGNDTRVDGPVVGIPSADGESLLFSLHFTVLDDSSGNSLPHTHNPVLLRRHPDGWRGESVNNVPAAEPLFGGQTNPAGLSSDLGVQAWQHTEPLFSSGTLFGTRLFGDAGGTIAGSGWYDWDPAGNLTVLGGENPDSALLTEAGGTLVRWGGATNTYRGLLGPTAAEDPSNLQLAGQDGGDAVYLQRSAGSGPVELVNGCTGTGTDATRIPMLDDKGNNQQAQAFVSTTAGSAQVTVDSLLAGSFASGQTLLALGAGGQFPPGTSVVAVSGSTVTMSGSAAGTVSSQPMIANGNPNDDEIASQACEAGAVTSARGATVGGGGPWGGPGNRPGAGAIRRALSDDGSRVFFASPDPHTNGSPVSCGSAVGVATSCPPQLYVRQYDSASDAVVRWISRSRSVDVGDGRYGGAPLVQAPSLFGSGMGYEGASADGRVVYFKTNAPLTPDDPNATGTPGPKTTGTASSNSWDLYRYELPADDDEDPASGTLMRVSGGPDGGDPDAGGDYDPNVLDDSSSFAAQAGALRYLSDDGQKAYFVTRGVIGSPSDPWNSAPAGGTTAPGGTAATTTTRNLYLFDAAKAPAERWKFVARIPWGSVFDACASQTVLSGMPQNPFDEVDAVTGSVELGRQATNCVHGLPSGSTIAFETRGQLTGDDGDTAGDIYLYDAEADELTRVSAPPSDESGYICEDNALGRCNATLGRQTIMVPSHENVGLNGAQNQNFAVYDGEVSLFFESRVQFVPEDVNGSQMDVYEWRNGELSLVSSGTSDDGAFFSGNTVDGEDAFFATSESIDPREIDADYDIYDARLGGGFPLPDPVDRCEALTGGCQGAGNGGQVDGSSESDKAGGGGNADTGARVSLSVVKPGARALRRTARSGVLALRVSSSGAGMVRAAASGRVGGKSREVASARKRFARAGSATLRLRLSSAAMGRLRSRNVLRLSVVVSAPDARQRSVALRIERGSR